MPCLCVSAVRAAVEHVDEAIDCGDALALLSALQSPSLGLRGLIRDNSDWYLDQLSSDREQKALVRPLYYMKCLRCGTIMVTICIYVHICFVLFLISRIWGVWTLWRETSCRKASVWLMRKLNVPKRVSSSPVLRLD